MTEVKKRGKKASEKFDPEKLRASIIGTCLSVRAPIGEAEDTAETVTRDVATALANTKEIASDEIRTLAAKRLAVYNPEAAYFYRRQKRII